ncbi:transcription elongation factor, mitochondrial [Bufo bufo]|uniref:transcription elongation factor, mitochondrial n=1 Tax=Bufo bufo TaxID=8384 RepID=UPI001ABE41AD|nr:transcription elongation factor, mitochondrial [Bufo bufo]
MSGTLKTLINGGMKIFLRPLYCTRAVRSSPQEGSHGAFTTPEQPDASHAPAPSCTPSDAKKRGRRDSANFLKPEVAVERLQAADSIVSIVFGLKRLAWAHVDRTLTLRDWQQHEWYLMAKGRQPTDLYLEDVSSAVSKLPAADIYILERSSLSAQNTSLFPVMLHLRIVEAMLYALLNPAYVVAREHRVFSMARTTVGKHFDIMVGGCKTSGVDLVQQLVEEAGTLEQPRLRFTPDLLLQYKHKCLSRGQNRNEELCDALLQAIAFYELIRNDSTV